MMENLYKQFAELVTRWEFKTRDEFFVTRVRLTALYTTLAIIFLIITSSILYGSLTSRLAESAHETIRDPLVRDAVLNKAGDIIKNLILLGDGIIFIIVIVAGFFLTKRTLKPIQDMVKKQNRFIADASHELRTPLSVMKTSIEVSLRQKDLSVAEAQDILVSTLEEVDNLTSLSNDLLAVSKENSSDIKLENIYLPTVLKKTIKRISSLAREKKISLVVYGQANKEDVIMGSESMISQVFYNLIHNALVYTKEGGKVSIEYLVKRGRYAVNISDTGIGIEKKNLAHIFEPFYRADNARTTAGSGLGLSIVKSHIDLHSGSINVKSEVGKGTNITVELPTVS